MMLLAFGSVKAQDKLIPTPDGDGSKINTLVVDGTGNIYVQLGNKLMMNDNGRHSVRYSVEDSVLYVNSGWPVTITMQNLTYLRTSGTGGVNSKGMLRGDNLSVDKTGTGNVSLEVDYDNVYVHTTGIGNVVLSGDCNVFCSEEKGIGKVNANNLKYKVLVAKSGDRWNMAFNLDDAKDGASFQNMVNEAQPFFEAESQKSWNQKATSDKGNMAISDKAELDQLMQEYNANLQRIHDSIDWKRIHEEMRQAGQEIQRAYDSVDWEQFERDMEKWGEEMEKWGRKMEKWGERWEEKYGRNNDYPYYRPEQKKDVPQKEKSKGKHPEKKNLLFDAHWNGFEAGLNMLFNTPVDVVNANNGSQGMEIRPLRSWYFGFNIADVGVAFSKSHIVGLFTGVGIGWNNFSWNNDVKIDYDPDNVVYTLVPIDEGKIVKNTKCGVLFLQVPMMLEIRPTRSMYIDAGVTGGLRIAQWNRVKFADGSQVKNYYSAKVNQFKLDASLRVGGRNVGFFANYALLPLFDMSNAKVHPLSFGFSINF